MKLAWAVALGTVLVGAIAGQNRPAAIEPWAIVVGGDLQGYLSPCGCVKPMTGGVTRRVTAVRALSLPNRTVVVESGSFSGFAGSTRQAELKAEALAEVWRRMGVTAANVSAQDAGLGIGVLGSVQRLSGGVLTSATVAGPEGVEWGGSVSKGPIRVIGVEPQGALLASRMGGSVFQPVLNSVRAALEEADAEGQGLVVMLQGDRAAAAQLAQQVPGVDVIVFRSTGSASDAVERVGSTVLVTPGEKGKAVVRLIWQGGRVTQITRRILGPEVADDRRTVGLFRSYQTRVRDENLIAQMSRRETPEYAGNTACMSCHAEAAEVWMNSAHAGALKTLEDEFADKDPECISCHVVGMDSVKGFQSRDLTEELANVGCESCHGPGAAHAAKPMEVRLPKVTEQTCMTCHDPNHSPGFRYETYWPKIAH